MLNYLPHLINICPLSLLYSFLNFPYQNVFSKVLFSVKISWKTTDPRTANETEYSISTGFFASQAICSLPKPRTNKTQFNSRCYRHCSCKTLISNTNPNPANPNRLMNHTNLNIASRKTAKKCTNFCEFSWKYNYR